MRLQLINGWLFTIDESRVKDEETRQRVLTYKRECYDVLYRHFIGTPIVKGRSTSKDEAPESDGSRLRMVTETRQLFGRSAAAQLWFKLGLPTVPAMMREPLQGNFDFSSIQTPPDEAAAR